LAAEVDLPTDTVIFMVLIGILGWVFWVYTHGDDAPKKGNIFAPRP
jgi:hypothetical protein